ncbi:MAG: hypothetical protein NC548_43150 [Lachnospiraceae bacterium]|nr:hypothetical protein [Lachnospiraceae bacterium]MCM1230899.1 hypothetical protein [Ruminococcus flavefaciens]
MLNFSGVFYIDAEKIENKGEDSLTFKFDENGNGYMSVFDGCGGAGSEKHSALNSEKSAYIASRSCALFMDFYNSHQGLSDVGRFNKDMYSYLLNLNKEYPMDFSDSTLVDVLPTTISGACIKSTGNELAVNFIWAGDSRGYIIDENGLSQVTEDDVNSKDAYYNLFDDSIMSNRIHGNINKKIFELHTAGIKLKDRCIIICATDGCYDYFNSPMVFEFLLVTMLSTSNSFSEAEEKLLDVLHDKSGDDCSLTAVFYGFEDYMEIKDFLQKRFLELNADKNKFNELYWNEQYKKHYYRYNKLRCDSID